MGLELFEALLDIRLPAEAALREINLRPPGAGTSSMMPRPRRRRRRRGAGEVE